MREIGIPPTKVPPPRTRLYSGSLSPIIHQEAQMSGQIFTLSYWVGHQAEGGGLNSDENGWSFNWTKEHIAFQPTRMITNGGSSGNQAFEFCFGCFTYFSCPAGKAPFGDFMELFLNRNQLRKSQGWGIMATAKYQDQWGKHFLKQDLERTLCWDKPMLNTEVTDPGLLTMSHILKCWRFACMSPNLMAEKTAIGLQVRSPDT